MTVSVELDMQAAVLEAPRLKEEPWPSRFLAQHQARKYAELFQRVVRNEGWSVEYLESPSEHPGRLGTPQTDPLCAVQACAGNVLAVKPGSEPDAWYAAAHEISEARHDFRGHTQHVWREQCNILARWCKQLGRG